MKPWLLNAYEIIDNTEEILPVKTIGEKINKVKNSYSTQTEKTKSKDINFEKNEDSQIAQSINEKSSNIDKSMKEDENLFDDQSEIVEEEVVSKKFKQIQFAPRPWMTPEATVNKSSLKRMLFSVLSRIACNPGATKKKIYNHFQKKLCTVEINELLDILKKIGTIKFKYLRDYEKPTLFSKRRKISISDPIKIAEDDDEIFLTVNPLAFLKISEFFEAL